MAHLIEPPPITLSSIATLYTCQNPGTAPASVVPGAGASIVAPGQPGNCGTGPSTRYMVWASRSTETRKDLNGIALQGRRVDVSDVDKYGNAARIRSETLNPDGSLSGHSTVTDSWFSNDEAQWLLGLRIRSTVTATTP